ncbi:MAG: hypothetical protein ACFFCQ_11685, partial [Promethearchaeota archaeon]
MNSSIQGSSEEAAMILKPKFLIFVAFLKSLGVALFLAIFGGIGVLMVTLIASGEQTTNGTVDSNAGMMFVVGFF